MFRQRLFTAIPLVFLVLFVIYFAPLVLFEMIIGLLIALAAFEWTKLVPIRGVAGAVFFVAAVVFLGVIAAYHFSVWLITGMVLWGLILAAVLFFPASQRVWGYPWVVALSAGILLPLFANALVFIDKAPQGQEWILYLLCLVWASDIGAYLVGKQWGHHKFIKAVSPQKSIEGAIGGLLLVLLVATVGYYYFHSTYALVWYGVAIATALISMLGDLFISMLKRRSKVKDTGQLLPGHGGILDRIDSLIAATPLFFLGLRVFQWS